MMGVVSSFTVVDDDGNEFEITAGPACGWAAHADGSVTFMEGERRWTEPAGSAAAVRVHGLLPFALPHGPETPWWYLSFASEAAFLGGCYVQGVDEGDAWRRATELGVNPGGEVALVRLAPGEIEQHVPVGMRERLLSREEIEAPTGGGG